MAAPSSMTNIPSCRRSVTATFEYPDGLRSLVVTLGLVEYVAGVVSGVGGTLLWFWASWQWGKRPPRALRDRSRTPW